MISNILKDKPTKLFVGFTAFFVANALIAETIGTKIFSLEKLFGAHPSNFTIFGQSGISLILPVVCFYGHLSLLLQIL
jgi:hypothetical protein